MSRWKRVRLAAAVVAFNLAAAAALGEVSLFALLRMPAAAERSPAVVRSFAQKVYRHFQRNIIQYDADCAQYHQSLGYTLKPGTCTFENLEFSNEFRVNSMGLRDDERALAAPEVIFLGDSQAMGWGVPQDRAMPQALARLTGLRVLNAAVSSYGTVRERRMLEMLDRSALRAVVLQYCDNDSPENLTFQSRGNTLPTMSEATYREASKTIAREKTYYPGKYMFRLVLKALHLEAPEVVSERLEPTLTPEAEARLFVNALVNGGSADLSGVQFIVFEVNSNPARPRTFLRSLGTVKTTLGYPPFVRSMALVETEGVFGPSDFYVLDDHLTVNGNARVARMVADALAATGVTPH